MSPDREERKRCDQRPTASLLSQSNHRPPHPTPHPQKKKTLWSPWQHLCVPQEADTGVIFIPPVPLPPCYPAAAAGAGAFDPESMAGPKPRTYLSTTVHRLSHEGRVKDLCLQPQQREGLGEFYLHPTISGSPTWPSWPLGDSRDSGQQKAEQRLEMKEPILHSSVVPRDEHCDLVPSLQPAVLLPL